MLTRDVIHKINNINKISNKIKNIIIDSEDKLNDSELSEINSIILTYRDYLQKKFDNTEVKID